MAAIDEYPDNRYAMHALVSPSRVWEVTPDNDNDLPYVTLGILIAGDGDLHIVDGKGDEETIPAGYLAIQTQYSMRIQKIFATGTTATGILAFS